METDEEIAAEVAAFAPIVGPTHAEWYAEACRVEGGGPEQLQACRVRELVRTTARDLGGLAHAAEKLIAACESVSPSIYKHTKDVQDGIDAVRKALWWKE